ncbi:Uma2 family endonuclease [Streptomyces boninensis]|uniref:Uma2 family endonuclease n=1 Tax=Streptomyces boninensis TaxID=2039455 RepID=UPI003B2250CE
MTLMAERAAQLAAKDFEELAKAAERLAVPVRLEYIYGRIGVKGVTDGDHGEIIGWLQEQCMQFRPQLRVYSSGIGLEVEGYRKGRAKPDLILAPKGAFAGHGDWASTEQVLMVVEVTSYDTDTDRRDRKEKPWAYAEAEIPVYLLIDRDAGTITVHSRPVSGRYRDLHTVDFGERVGLPDPVGIALDTEELKDYAR